MAGCIAASLALPGCAGNNDDDVAGALLIGAAVVGLGVLAASGSDDDDDYGQHRRRHDHRRYGYDSGYSGRYAGNGRCDDARYRTSNGGRAAAGSDERDCRRFGDGRK